jgi:hypothetical protein
MPRVPIVFLLCVSLLCLPATEALAAKGEKATYIGGSVPGLPDESKGRIVLEDEQCFRFDSNKLDVRIPWAKINLIEYGQKVSRRYALGILLSPMFLLSKSRKHFMTLSFLDEKDRQQVMLFQVDDDDLRTVLMTIEARTGLEVEFQDNDARFEGAG